MDGTRTGIVVGYDGSAGAARALDWATVEADRRRTELVVCSVVRHTRPDPRTYGTVELPDPRALEDAVRLVDEALGRALEVAPRVPMTGLTPSAPTAPALLEAARDAEMLVVGSRGRGGLASLVLGSVSAHVVGRADCPVVVVPPPPPRKDAAAGPHGRVVVGIDGSAEGEAALAFAVEEALLRGAQLEVAHSWFDGYVAAGLAVPSAADIAAREAHAGDLVRDAVEPWMSKYPELEVGWDLGGEAPAALLVERSADADLLVMGSRGHGVFAGILLGSVSHAVLHAARCPVAVVGGAGP